MLNQNDQCSQQRFFTQDGREVNKTYVATRSIINTCMTSFLFGLGMGKCSLPYRKG